MGFKRRLGFRRLGLLLTDQVLDALERASGYFGIGRVELLKYFRASLKFISRVVQPSFVLVKKPQLVEGHRDYWLVPKLLCNLQAFGKIILSLVRLSLGACQRAQAISD